MAMKEMTEYPPVFDRGAPTYFVNGLLPVEHVGNGNLMFAYIRQDNTFGALRREIELRLIVNMQLIPIFRRQIEVTLSGIHLPNTRPDTALLM